ncbi:MULTISPECIES: GNAT family N-acetyltransferase [unclassified Methylobacterium]|uniref:GNAT family N-acetyltransferase n=1 Tax=unclassified Methylobacterium TaxID=2615210 RepID=UPI0006FCC813|nr:MULTISPECIES: GNAT family N-acetyltransferase [unclassified Methylobacterium]KQP88488.1 GCN5 family acetyltransferase [Methylobacterium sp. Leaf117]KQP95105.1 GCN5 family acetyltransferase [Methylobacterium sp. Leaf113]MCK2057046.1 GNAT family N-acetyltransferase [Methylobacterium sp. 37f]
MRTSTISIRRARPADVDLLADLFDETWREAYRGIIPGVALERMISQRSSQWWLGATQRSRPLVVVERENALVAYAVYGPARGRTLQAPGEIDELYVRPSYQGLGLGRRLFRAVSNDLADHGLARVGVWALEENDRARTFYSGLGGAEIARAVDRMAGTVLPKIGFRFT